MLHASERVQNKYTSFGLDHRTSTCDTVQMSAGETDAVEIGRSSQHPAAPGLQVALDTCKIDSPQFNIAEEKSASASV